MVVVVKPPRGERGLRPAGGLAMATVRVLAEKRVAASRLGRTGPGGPFSAATFRVCAPGATNFACLRSPRESRETAARPGPFFHRGQGKHEYLLRLRPIPPWRPTAPGVVPERQATRWTPQSAGGREPVGRPAARYGDSNPLRGRPQALEPRTCLRASCGLR